MANNYCHLSYEDRKNIEDGLNDKNSITEISIEINRSHSTILREIERNKVFSKPSNWNCGNRYENPGYNPHRSKLDKSPYVCNGCKRRTRCTLSKIFYDASYAQEEYEATLKESRSGVIITQEEINHLSDILTPLIKENDQSIHHAVINTKNRIMFSEKKIYKLINLGLLKVRNINLPRKIRFRQRKKKLLFIKWIKIV